MHVTNMASPPKSANELRDEYLKLLEGKHVEQTYQSFIENNTRLIPRDFMQNHGIHLSLVLRKLSFGADYKSDFFFLSKSSDDWNAVLWRLRSPVRNFLEMVLTNFTQIFCGRFSR